MLYFKLFLLAIHSTFNNFLKKFQYCPSRKIQLCRYASFCIPDRFSNPSPKILGGFHPIICQVTGIFPIFLPLYTALKVEKSFRKSRLAGPSTGFGFSKWGRYQAQICSICLLPCPGTKDVLLESEASHWHLPLVQLLQIQVEGNICITGTLGN